MGVCACSQRMTYNWFRLRRKDCAVWDLRTHVAAPSRTRSTARPTSGSGKHDRAEGRPADRHPLKTRLYIMRRRADSDGDAHTADLKFLFGAIISFRPGDL